MPLSIPGRLIGVGWSAPCVLRHLRTPKAIIRASKKLFPGEVVEMEFILPDGQKVHLTGAVDLEPSQDGWSLSLIEFGAGYQELRDTLTLTERAE